MKSLLALGFSASSAACVWLLLLSLLYVPCGKGDEGEGNAVSAMRGGVNGTKSEERMGSLYQTYCWKKTPG